MLASTYTQLLKHPCVLHRWLTAGQRLCQYQQQEHPFGDRGEEMTMLVLHGSLPFPAHWPEEQLNHKQPLARVAQTTAHTIFSPEMPRISLELLEKGSPTQVQPPCALGLAFTKRLFCAYNSKCQMLNLPGALCWACICLTKKSSPTAMVLLSSKYYWINKYKW